MKKLLNSNILFIPIGLFIVVNVYFQIRSGVKNNESKCRIVPMPIKGVITWKSGHGSYNYIVIDNAEKSVRLSIDEIKYTKGFEEGYLYEIGDSIIKEAGSNEFTIKRGSNIAVHIINCDD